MQNLLDHFESEIKSEINFFEQNSTLDKKEIDKIIVEALSHTAALTLIEGEELTIKGGLKYASSIIKEQLKKEDQDGRKNDTH